MTKKLQAQSIFNDMAYRPRAEVIEAFMTQLDMTKAGASTYYATCKKEYFGESASSNASDKPSKGRGERSDGMENKTLYTVCTPGQGEDGSTVVESTHSYFRSEDAKKYADRNQVVVKGLPDIGADWSKLKPVI